MCGSVRSSAVAIWAVWPASSAASNRIPATVMEAMEYLYKGDGLVGRQLETQPGHTQQLVRQQLSRLRCLLKIPVPGSTDPPGGGGAQPGDLSARVARPGRLVGCWRRPGTSMVGDVLGAMVHTPSRLEVKRPRLRATN